MWSLVLVLTFGVALAEVGLPRQLRVVVKRELAAMMPSVVAAYREGLAVSRASPATQVPAPV
jgi:hypothetical protein